MDIGPKMVGHEFKKLNPHTFNLPGFKISFEKLWENILREFRKKIHKKISEGIINNITLLDICSNDFDFFGDITRSHLELNAEWWQNFKNNIVKIGFKEQRKENMRLNAEVRILVGQLQTAKNTFHRERIEKSLNKIMDKLSQSSWNADYVYDRLSDERCSKDFLKIFNLSKKDLYIGNVTAENGTILTNHEQKCRHLVEKYTELYNINFPVSSNPDRFAAYLEFTEQVPKIPAEVQQDTGPFTLSEIEFSINKAQCKKCPGSDGIPIEFYKQYFKYFGPALVEVFNNVNSSAVFPKDWSTSIIKLIPKKSDSISFDSLRPLQLIVNDCKLYSDVFCIRMSKLFHYIVNEFQSGGVRGRNVNASLMLVHLLFHYIIVKKESGFIFSIDNKKAFDRILREFLYFCLKRYGFDHHFVQSISNLYANNSSKIILNGYFTEEFPVTNGVKQGDPLSAALYVLAVEPLARAVQNAIHVQALKLPNLSEIKTIQHMDDMSFFLRNVESIHETLKIIQKFNYVSGSEINYTKSAIIKIGYTGLKYFIEGIPVLGKSEFIKLLGIYFGGNIEEYVQYNWEEKIKTIKTLVTLWGKEDISILGRSLVANLKILSKISYILSILEISNFHLDKINNIIQSFVCKNKTDLPMEKLTLQKENGGVGLINILDRSAAMKLNFLKACYYSAELSPVVKNVTSLFQYFLDQSIFNVSHEHMVVVGPNIDFFSINIKQKYVFFQQMFCFFKTFLNLKKEHSIDTMSTKEYYKILRNRNKHWINSINFGAYIVNEEDKKKVWKRIWADGLNNKVISFNYILAHSRIKCLSRVHAVRARGNFFCELTWCTYCKNTLNIERQVENPDHIFIDCPIASLTWDHIKAKLIMASPDMPILGHSVDDNGQLRIDRTKILYKLNTTAAEAYFISELNFILWKNRCVNYKQNKSQDHRCVLLSLKSKLKIMSAIDSKYLASARHKARWKYLDIIADFL